MKVRTRFAPSPTGDLHVGGVRTALFSWLYAKHHGGDFLLRIEDTDVERSTECSTQVILDGLAWLNIQSDEPICYQSQRFDYYKEIIEKLLTSGQAYRCYCSKQRLEEVRAGQMAAKEKPRYDGHCRDKNLPETNEPHVIRFRNPDSGAVHFVDQVYGDITVQNSELDDLIIARTDGTPTYNLCVVADDLAMGITHVIRGEDHVNNTPKQINILKALGADVPVYAHLPMILGEDGKRLSKRHGAVSVLEFREQGILPQALLNYLVRLGWSHGDQEIFSRNEMIRDFDLPAVNRSSAGFNHDKLCWLNQHYLKTTPVSDFLPDLLYQFQRLHLEPKDGPVLEKLVVVQAERCKTLSEIVEKSEYFYKETLEYERIDEAARKKLFKADLVRPLSEIRRGLFELSAWEASSIHTVIKETLEKLELSLGKVGPTLRLALTGTTTSPSIDVTLELLGKQRTLDRLKSALDYIEESDFVND